MRALLAIRTLAVLGVVVSALALGSQAIAGTQQLNGAFTVQFGRGLGTSNAPCPAETFCGTGTLAGLGQATDTIEFTSFEPIEGTSCSAVTFVETIELLDGTGTLVLPSEGTFCSPGGSDSTPVPPQAYGHPHTVRASFTIDGASSTGSFAGASGSGTKSIVLAGDVATIRLSGTITRAS